MGSAPILPPTSCEIVGKLLKFSVSQFLGWEIRILLCASLDDVKRRRFNIRTCFSATAAVQ